MGFRLVISINTTGVAPDRVELKEYIYREAGVDVDAMHEEVPCEIGKVVYSEWDDIVSVELEDWVKEEYLT